MTWQKLTLQVPDTLVDKFSSLLMDMGAVAVTLEASDTEELFEPDPGAIPLWQHTTLQALFDNDTNLKAVIAQLTAEISPGVSIDDRITTVADQDWQKVCQDAFQPVCFADKLWIQPSWQFAEQKAGAVYVTLDPGMAFGTGSHPTTALCLEWLAQNIDGQDTVIDYGCGSGILAIAALKLDAKTAWAVDNDPQALEATVENGKRNQIGSSLHVALPAEVPLLKADILIANILANPLKALAPQFIGLLKPKGKLVLSGVLPEQAEAVMQSYIPEINFLPIVEKDGWVRLEGWLNFD